MGSDGVMRCFHSLHPLTWVSMLIRQKGPLSTAFRLLPRLLNQLFSPASLLAKLPFTHSPSSNSSRRAVKITKTRKAKVEQLLSLLEEAKGNGCAEAWAVEGKMRMVSLLSVA